VGDRRSGGVLSANVARTGRLARCVQSFRGTRLCGRPGRFGLQRCTLAAAAMARASLPPARAPHASRRVSVSALAVDGEEARLELTVSRGERLHREVYSLRRRPSPFGWAVIDMRVTGLLVRVLPPSFDAASHAGNDHVARVRWLRCSEHLVPRAEGARRYLTPAAQQCWPISRGVDHQRAAMTLVQVHKRRFIRAREIQPA
jgi:hypothetical protein